MLLDEVRYGLGPDVIAELRVSEPGPVVVLVPVGDDASVAQLSALAESIDRDIIIRVAD